MADLQAQPQRRDGGTARELTIRELARDILVMVAKKTVGSGVSMAVACADVNSTTSRVRLIAHAKRKKLQTTETYFHATERILSPATLLSSLGNYTELMKGKNSFIPWLFEEMAIQLKGGDCPDDDWYPTRLFGQTAFLLLGGSPLVCALVGPLNVRVSSTCVLDRRSIQEQMKTVPQQARENECYFHSCIGFCAWHSTRAMIRSIASLTYDAKTLIALLVCLRSSCILSIRPVETMESTSQEPFSYADIAS
jgi:hypothetical protein